MLSFFGSVMLVVLVMVWSMGLTVGAALLFYPYLGTSIRDASGQATPTDFMTALYAAAGSISIVGSGNFAPQTATFRFVYLINSLIGVSIISLTVTYLLQVYSALQRRNATTLAVHLSTGETGDAVELILGLAPDGDFGDAPNWLYDRTGDIANMKESHHFYPLLGYFRFEDAFYSVARVALVMLDAVTLIKSALSDERYAKLKESGAVNTVWGACLRMLVGLETTLFPLDDEVHAAMEPDEATCGRWRERYFAAIDRLRQSGVPVMADTESGIEIYLSLRARWDHYLTLYARYMGLDMEEIDPAGARPQRARERQDVGMLLHAVR